MAATAAVFSTARSAPGAPAVGAGTRAGIMPA